MKRMSSLAEFVDRTAHLPPAYAVAIGKLMVEIERNGPLPTASADRSILAGIALCDWSDMEPILARYFELDADGGWHIYELEAEREKRLAARRAMSEAGKRGGAKKAANASQRRQGVDGGRTAHPMESNA